MISRTLFAVAAAASVAGEAAAQERWAATFRQGFATAAIATRRGEALRLTCDTSGRKPGRGSLTVELRSPRGSPPPAATTAVAVEIVAAGQTVRLPAYARLEPAPEPPRAPPRRSRSDAPAEPPAADLVTLTYELDGSAAEASPFAAAAAAIAREPREIALRAPALKLETKLPTAQARAALRGFAKGCQDFLPAADDELQWDWQQGLDRVDGQLQVTLATSAEARAGQGDAPKLMLACVAGFLRAEIRGAALGAADGVRASLVVHGEDGVSLGGDWPGRPAPGGGWMIEGEEAARFIAALWPSATATILLTGAATEEIAFPVAGLPLATRKLLDACPTALLPPKG